MVLQEWVSKVKQFACDFQAEVASEACAEKSLGSGQELMAPDRYRVSERPKADGARQRRGPSGPGDAGRVGKKSRQGGECETGVLLSACSFFAV